MTLNVGVLNAGEGRNVILHTHKCKLRVRGENEKINNYMTEEALRRARGVALSSKLKSWGSR